MVSELAELVELVLLLLILPWVLLVLIPQLPLLLLAPSVTSSAILRVTHPLKKPYFVRLFQEPYELGVPYIGH